MDNTTLFLKNKTEVPHALSVIKTFSEVSGLNINLNKCEILVLKDITDAHICNILVKNTIKYLGIMVTEDDKRLMNDNLNPVITSVEKKFASWSARVLSLYGRVLLSEAEGLSRASDVLSSAEITNQNISSLDRLLLDFIWKNKPHKVKTEVMSLSLTEGGPSVLDLSSFNNIIKINWIKRFLKNPDSMWNTIPNFLFQKVGGLDFLLMCLYAVGKLPIKLSDFHKQALLCWSLLYKYNYSPHKYF